MKVILRQSVPNLGESGEIVAVRDGYARNYLLPRKLAVQADSASAKKVDHEKALIARQEEKRRAGLAELAQKLANVTVEVSVRAGDEDKIFGSVTAQHIADKLAEMGYNIDRRTIALDEPIRSLGVYAVPVRLGAGLETNVKVWVAGEEGG